MMRTIRRPRHLAPLLALLICGGCSSEKPDVLRVPDSHAATPAGREWWKVYSVEFQGDRKIRTQMGFLYRQVNSRDPRSENYFVLDRGLRQVGFVLASDFRAFVFVDPRPPLVKATTQQVSLGDLSNGVKRILQCPGTVELEKENVGQPGPSKTASTASAR
jgi:hypothetical protein